MVCGRCGNRTAPSSTYCPRCHWTLFVDAPSGEAHLGQAVAALQVPRAGGMLARRRMERRRAHLERDIRNFAEKRIKALEDRLEDDALDAAAHRALGELTLLENSWERAHAHLQRAHELEPGNFETHINLAIVLAHRGQLQPALELLQEARRIWPHTPAVLFNLALAALQARRAALVIEAADELEQLWHNDPEIALDLHDDTLTARGLALLLLGRAAEARAALEAAARHTDVPAHDARHHAARSNPPHQAAPVASPAPAGATNPAPGDASSSVASSGVASSNDVSLNGDRAGGAQNGHQMRGDEQRQGDRRQGDRRVAPPDASWPHAERRAQRRQGERRGAARRNEDLLETEEFDLSEVRVADADLLNNLALAEAELGNFERALARLAAAMRVEPGNARVLNNLGVMAYQQGHLPAAHKYLVLARQIEDHAGQREPITHAHLGVVLSAMGRVDESWEEFQRAGGHESAEFEVWYNLGRAYIGAGRPDRGMDYMRRAFQANPQHADVHTVLGAAYLLRGQSATLGEALKHFKRALHLSPRHRVALCDLIMTLLEMENDEGAVMVLNQALRLYPKNAEVIFLRALQTVGGADDEHMTRAATQFNAALLARPDLLACLYNTSLCQFMMGLRDAACREMEEVTRRDPSFAPAYYMIGIGHAVSRRYDEALSAWLKAVQYEPNNPDLQANLGFVYYQRGDWDKAVAHYFRAHHLAPGEADILSCLGLSYGRAAAVIRNKLEALAAKRAHAVMKPTANALAHEAQDKRNLNELLSRAIASFQASLELKPHVPVTHSNLGLAFYFVEQVERAVEQWRIVSRLDPGYARRREEEQYQNFDETQVLLRPLRWRERVVRMAPLLPQPHMRLVPGYNARAFWPAFSDSKMQEIAQMRRDLEYTARMLGWMSAHR